MGFYEITQNNLKKELLLLHEVQNELNKLPEGTLQRKDKRGRVEYYTRKNGKRQVLALCLCFVIKSLKNM